MAEGHWSLGRRVIVEDVRRDDTFMRVTWHMESNVFVVSHWRGEVCVAATRIGPEAAPDLVNLLVKGLAESGSAAVLPAPERANGPLRRVLMTLRRWCSSLRPSTQRDEHPAVASDVERRRTA